MAGRMSGGSSRARPPVGRGLQAARRAGLAVACALLMATAATGQPAVLRAGALELSEARIPSPPAEVAALYLRVVDTGSGGDRLVGASATVARRCMLHRTVEHEGMVHMQPAEDGLAVPAGGVLQLAPGGAHVMLMGLSRRLAAGDRVAVELRFERAGRVMLDVPVVDAAAAASGGHEGHGAHEGGGDEPSP